MMMKAISNRKRNHRGRVIKKVVPQSQQISNDILSFKKIEEPIMRKIASEIKAINKSGSSNNHAKKDLAQAIMQTDLKKELIYKRDVEEKQMFPKGKFILALEPSEKKEYFIMRLKESLNPKKQVAWVDFYDLTKAADEVYEFTLQEEGLVQWDNMVAVLNFKVKKGEVVNSIKLSNSNGLLTKIMTYTGIKQEKKRTKKEKSKLKREEVKGESDSGSDVDETIKAASENYDPSGSSDTESLNLLPRDDEEEKKDSKQKKFKKRRKTPAQKAAIEEQKRVDAENQDRRIHIPVIEQGIKIIKTRIADDGITTEEVEIDPTILEVRPRKWKFIERQEENKDIDIVDEEIMKLAVDTNLVYIGDSVTTTNRNIIRAAVTDNLELAKLCIDETETVSSLMESWSPEIKSTAIELAIRHNSRKVLELLLKAKDRPNTEDKLLISKFDTGQVSNRAFGTKVRKVEMMRGARQGNNAFMQDNRRNEEYKTCVQQLLEDEILAIRVAYS